MRSHRADLLRAALLAACVCGMSGARAQDAAHAAAAASTPAVAADPRAARIEAATERLRADPLLSG